MTVAVLGALVIGEWFEAATVSFLFALSLAIESWSIGRARRAISELLDLAPPTARLLRPDGSEVVVSVSDVKPGDRFVVAAGERIALDGHVVAGSSAVNQAPITGESLPVEKQAGAEVFAGTINGDGALTVEATKVATDTTLARIIHMVEEAHARRAPSEQWVERFARVYTPVVMAAAILVFLVPPLAFGQAWDELVLPSTRSARDRLPVCARDFDASLNRRLAGLCGASRRSSITVVILCWHICLISESDGSP